MKVQCTIGVSQYVPLKMALGLEGFAAVCPLTNESGHSLFETRDVVLFDVRLQVETSIMARMAGTKSMSIHHGLGKYKMCILTDSRG